jgi:hypothetical protein
MKVYHQSQKAMKRQLIVGLCLFSQVVFADGLPVITVPPASQIVSPGSTATLAVTATGATGFQWRFNGTDISGATNSTLQITNAQAAKGGYYMAVAKNATGWAPSPMAYLSVVASSGIVPFSNATNTGWAAQACYQAGDVWIEVGTPITNGTAQVIAGPALDQMQPVGACCPVTNGYFDDGTRSVPTVEPGQTVFYRVDISYPYYESGTFTQHSRVLALIAGGGANPIPSAGSLRFPWYIEWPDPISYGFSTPTSQVRIPGETVGLSDEYYCDYAYCHPQFQWRKDGNPVPGATNYVLLYEYLTYFGRYRPEFTIANAQAADAGNYDVVINGNYCFVDIKTTLSMQLTNGPGVLLAPRIDGSNFVCELLGAAGRYYALQWSTNLTDWHNFATQFNATGTMTFSNSPIPGGAQFYRARLQP